MPSATAPPRTSPRTQAQPAQSRVSRPGKLAYIFPNQTSSYRGMARGIHRQFPSVRDFFTRAEILTHQQVGTLVFDRSYQRALPHWIAQPWTYATSYSYFDILLRVLEVPPPDFAIGYSLGEISAIAAAEGLSAEEGLHLATRRGRIIQDGFGHQYGRMAVIRHPSRDVVQEIIDRITPDGETLGMAGHDSPGQTVLAGLWDSVRAYYSHHDSVRFLTGFAPLHTHLMDSVGDVYRSEILGLGIRPLRFPCVATSSPVLLADNLGQIKWQLMEQLRSAVMFEQGIQILWEQGVRTFVEIGPGRRLSGLVRETVARLNEDGEHVVFDYCDDGQGGFREMKWLPDYAVRKLAKFR